MSFCPKAVTELTLLQNLPGVPLDIESNRVIMSAAFRLDGDPKMTPLMCGFFMQVMALDKTWDSFVQVISLAHRIQATYKDEGMHLHYAIAAAMRIYVENPKRFAEMAR